MPIGTCQAFPLLALDNVTRCFAAGVPGCSATVRALHRVSCNLAPAEVVILGGKEGAGKSTLLGCAAGMLPPNAGRVLWAGSRCAPSWLAFASAHDLDRAAPTVGEYVEEALISHRAPVWELSGAVAHALARVGLEPQLRARIDALSPRDTLRLRVARAIARVPEVRLLLIDTPARPTLPVADALSVVGALAARLRCGVMMAAHSSGSAPDAAVRMLVLEHGRVAADRSAAPRRDRARAPAPGRSAAASPAVDPLPALL